MAGLYIYAQIGDTLELLLHRDLGLGPDMIGPICAVNHGLADNVILPAGTMVFVPEELMRPKAVQASAQVMLWE